MTCSWSKKDQESLVQGVTGRAYSPECISFTKASLRGWLNSGPPRKVASNGVGKGPFPGGRFLRAFSG